jgi:hypothetical protein
MPKIICKECQTEFRIAKSGAVAIDMFNDPPQPYQIWNCDAWTCLCGHVVLAGFAAHPFAVHYQDDFAEVLARVRSSQVAQEGWVIENMEHRQVSA